MAIEAHEVSNKIAFHWFENAEEVWQTMSHSWLKSSGCLLFSILGPNGLLQALPSPSLCLLLDFLGVTVAPLLCSSALGLMPLSAVHRLEDALRAAHHILGSSFAPPDLSIPSHLLRVQDLLYFSSLSAALVQVISDPFLRLQDASMFVPGFSEMATSAYFWLQTWADTWSLAKTMSSTMMIGEHLAELHLPADYVSAWVALNDACAAGPTVALAAALLRAGSYTVAFYPWNVETDREPAVLLCFSVFGVAGAFVIAEPWVDPIGSSTGV